MTAPPCRCRGRVEEGRGGLSLWQLLRFPSPLIEPDVRISRIRLSDRLHGKTHDHQSSSCHRSLLESVWRIVVLLGSSPIASPRFLHKHAGSEDPSLRQRYPVSTVLRSSPTPVRPAVLATALGPTRPRQVSPDNPHCLANVPCPLPRRIGSGAYARFPSLFRSAFPVAQAGRHPHHYFRGLLRLHSRYGPLARSAAQRRPLSQGSSPPGHPNKPLVSYSIKPATIEVESSSTGNTRLRGALCKIVSRGGSACATAPKRSPPSRGQALRTLSALRLAPLHTLH